MKKTLVNVWLFASTAAAIFYLFVVPALIANRTLKPSTGGTVFGTFLYLQLWIVIMESVYTSAASLYGFRRQHLIPSLVLRERKNPQPSVPRAVFFCVLSYFWSVYGFAIAYTYISRSDPKSFNVGELGLFDATYFSFTTAATVGYGDIVPISMVARMLVMLEIALGLMYVVFSSPSLLVNSSGAECPRN